MRQNKKYIIGVTGPIGSGKTTVTKILNNKGMYVINSDRIVHELYKKNNDLIKKIKDIFGEEVIKNNCIDREKLGEIVFNSDKKIKILNSIVHPIVYKEIEKKINSSGQKNIVIEVPLPDVRFKNMTDEIWAVIADNDKRLKRVMERNNISLSEVEQRFSKQITTEKYTNYADVVIENNESLDELEVKINIILKRITG